MKSPEKRSRLGVSSDAWFLSPLGLASLLTRQYPFRPHCPIFRLSYHLFLRADQAVSSPTLSGIKIYTTAIVLGYRYRSMITCADMKVSSAGFNLCRIQGGTALV